MEIFYMKYMIKKITAILSLSFAVLFYKNGERHNDKNGAHIGLNNFAGFWLNGFWHGYNTNFTKESWRKFVKLQAFL